MKTMPNTAATPAMENMQSMMNSMGMMMMPMGMPGMGMPMPMMMVPMMCQMSCKMTKTGMTCEITPMAGMSMEMLQQCCDRMNAMMNMGAPVMMSCGNMQPMMCVPCQK